MSRQYPQVALFAPNGELRPAAEMLERFRVDYAEVTMEQALVCGSRVVILYSESGAEAAELAQRTNALVLLVPHAGFSIERLTDGNVWPQAGSATFATLAIGDSGAQNAALLVVSILALEDSELKAAWTSFRLEQTAAVLREPPPAIPEQ